MKMKNALFTKIVFIDGAAAPFKVSNRDHAEIIAKIEKIGAVLRREIDTGDEMTTATADFSRSRALYILAQFGKREKKKERRDKESAAQAVEEIKKTKQKKSKKHTHDRHTKK